MICWHCLLVGAGNRVAVSVPPLRQMQGSTASDLGLPAGQPMNVFCAPTSPQSLQGQPQPAGYQPGQTNPGQPNPAQGPLQNPPGQTGPQNPAPGQQ
jgi:hypothetical protein